MATYTFYGKYKGIRNAAWNVLLDFSVASLPIKVIKLAKSMNIAVHSFDSGRQIIDFWDLHALCQNNDAFTALIDEQWYIFFDPTVEPRTQIRFALAHELGHILLGHELKTKAVSSFSADDITKKRKHTIETEADMFAIRLLAPACVLWGLGITAAEDIMTYCGIHYSEAKKRSDRMIELHKRNKWLTTSLEKQVFEQFRGYIEEQKTGF